MESPFVLKRVKPYSNSSTGIADADLFQHCVMRRSWSHMEHAVFAVLRSLCNPTGHVV